MKICRNPSLPWKAILTAFKIILKNKILEGGNIKEFENEFKKYVGMKHAIAVSSGRFAMYLIFKILDIKKNVDEIILPAFTPYIVAKIPIICGLKPVFVDIDPNTRNIDTSEIEKKITKNTKIIFIVYLYGFPIDIEKIAKIAKKHNILLIEDCAQALGARYKNKNVGNLGDINIFSFGERKTLNTYGGGMIVTNNDLLQQRIRKEIDKYPYPKKIEIIKRVIFMPLRWFVRTPPMVTLFVYPIYYVRRLINKNFISDYPFAIPESKIKKFDEKMLLKNYGTKYSNLQATIGLIQLKNLDEHIRAIHKNVKIINNFIKNPPMVSEHIYPSYFFYCIETNQKNKLLNKLFNEGILTTSAGYWALPDLNVFSDYKSDCPNARYIRNRIIFLPIQPELKKKDMMKIVKVLETMVK